ncbi:unnamed protein product [Caenorhabditis angaria]|uniref:J domain-containing protein n=1 Tax=Caenorhabditis angaria TaxID=860376 RepID=A0A9P1ISF2_9PELO|nr:unnamed protein product [Caenorhabditis angaria]
MPLKPGANPYKILGLETTKCTEKEITKAYRAQCLKWHPDKNLDNKAEAEARFIEAKEAFEFLFDEQKRNEYDKAEERVRIVEERNRERMEKADEFSESQKRRGNTVDDDVAKMTPTQAAKKRKLDENRIRDEMEQVRKQLEREANEEVQRQMRRVREAAAESAAAEKSAPKLIVKWVEKDGDGYDEVELRRIFEQYGKIAQISSIIAKKSRKKCIIEFEPTEKNLWGAEIEQGKTGKPEIAAEWISAPPVRKDAEKQKGNDLNQMSLEDLEAQILGGI